MNSGPVQSSLSINDVERDEAADDGGDGCIGFA